MPLHQKWLYSYYHFIKLIDGQCCFTQGCLFFCFMNRTVIWLIVLCGIALITTISFWGASVSLWKRMPNAVDIQPIYYQYMNPSIIVRQHDQGASTIYRNEIIVTCCLYFVSVYLVFSLQCLWWHHCGINDSRGEVLTPALPSFQVYWMPTKMRYIIIIFYSLTLWTVYKVQCLNKKEIINQLCQTPPP